LSSGALAQTRGIPASPPPGTAPTAPFDPGGSIGRAGARRRSRDRQANELPPRWSLAADWLAKEFHDAKSYGGFKTRCEEAWRGELSVDRLVSAYEQAMGPKARNGGALFMYTLRSCLRDG
jgi:hypothetical protein